MSWCKDSTSVGLSGLTVCEAAKGALLCEEFQKMPDPLFKVPNYISFFPDTSVMNEVIKDNLKCFCTYTVKYKKCSTKQAIAFYKKLRGSDSEKVLNPQQPKV